MRKFQRRGPLLPASKRDDWVDYAKAIGIVLVVYGHVARGLVSAGLAVDREVFALVNSLIYSFHMPLFFFLSGLFFQETLKRRGPGGLVLNKVDTILYPYLLWSIIQGAFELLLTRYTNGHTTINELVTIPWKPHAQFWFLWTLFMMFVLFAILFRPVLRAGASWSMLAMFAALYAFRSELHTETALDLLLNYGVFFASGVAFMPYRDTCQRRHVLLFVATGLVFVVCESVFHFAWGLRFDSAGLSPLLPAASGIAFSIASAMVIAHFGPRWLLWMGTASMAIYLMHILAASGTRVILERVAGVESVRVHLVIGTMAGLLLPMMTYAAIRRYQLEFLLKAPAILSASGRWPMGRAV